VCDDLTVAVQDGRATVVRNGCPLADPWFPAQTGVRPPVARVGDSAVEVGEAVGRAAEILGGARYPLIYGLSRSTTEGQRAATALADRIGATIDTTASTGHAPSLMALQQVGESTCSLGEVRQRADLVVYWGSDPLVTHPRHRERYAPPRPGRTTVVVDVRETASARAADLFVQVEPGRDWEALWALRLHVAGRPADGRFRDLAGRMKACWFGIVFFGGGLTRGGPTAHRTVEALLQLVTDLNLHTRFYARRMRRYGDVAGADSVLAWQTGYPFGVNLSAGYPRYNPGEFTGPEMLARGEPDACLLVGSDTVAGFPPAALEHLRRIPVIAVDSPGTECPVPAAVRLTTAVYGVHRPGTAYRMDEVPIPLRVLTPTDYPSDGEVLTAILDRLGPGGPA
jgi:formylmethanofuran dehydrogenase subunit B